MIDILIAMWVLGLISILVIGELSIHNYFDKFSVKIDEWIDVYLLTFASGTVLIVFIGIGYCIVRGCQWFGQLR